MNQIVFYSLEIALIFVASIIFLFVYFRKLKEDFLPSQIFRDGTIILFLTSLGAIISTAFVPGLWFWLSAIGFLIGFVVAIIRSRIPLFEGLEASTIGVFWLLFFYYLFQVIKIPEIPQFAGLLGIIFTFIIYLFFTFNYKRFTWYRSGKIGFAGLATLACFFLIRAITVLLFDNVLSLGSGRYDAIASGIVAFGLFFWLIRISLKNP